MSLFQIFSHDREKFEILKNEGKIKNFQYVF